MLRCDVWMGAPVKLANQLTLTTSQQPHDMEHPVPSFADTAPAISSVALDTVGGGVSGGEGMVVVMGGAGMPGISTTSIRLASCQTKGTRMVNAHTRMQCSAYTCQSWSAQPPLSLF